MTQYVVTGRAVQGDVYKMQPKKDNNNKTVMDPATGQPIMQYFLAVAVAKGDPKLPAVKAGLKADADRFWPNNEPARRDFAWKIVDGDDTVPNKSGKAPNTYEGFPGCEVFKFGTLYPPTVQYWDSHKGSWEDSVGGHVKIGDHVSVCFETTSNKSLQTPGLHLNPKLVGLEREGDAIVGQGGPDGNDVFGSRGPQSGAPAASTQGAAATGQSSTTAPAYDGHMQTDEAPPPPPPAGPVMTAKAGTLTYQSFIDKGWTDAALRSAGYIV